MNILQKKIRQWRINKAINERKNRDFIALSKAKHVVIIFDTATGETPPFVRTLINELVKEHKKQLKAFGFVTNSDGRIPSHNYCEFIFPSELSWVELPKKEFMEHYLQTEVDILIDLTTTEHAFTTYLVASSPAKMRVAYSTSCKKMIDLTIAPPLHSKEPVTDFLHYLNNINN